MTNEERLKLITKLAKKGNKKRKKVSSKKKIESNFVPLEPIAPSEHDINEEFEFLTNYNAENFLNNEEG